MTNEELAVIEARAEAATPGPWVAEIHSVDEMWKIITHTSCFQWMVKHDEYGPMGEVWQQCFDVVGEPSGYTGLPGAIEVKACDAEFIAAARTDIPALIAEIRRLQEALNETMKFNHLRNDRDAYLLALAEWGLKGKWGVDEEFTERPQRTTFGLDEE